MRRILCNMQMVEVSGTHTQKVQDTYIVQSMVSVLGTFLMVWVSMLYKCA